MPLQGFRAFAFRSCAAAFFLASLIVPLACDAQNSSAPDAGILAAIPGRMQPFVDQGQVSGIVTLVATADSVVHLSAVGVSDLQTGRQMETDDLFWIASMSKPVTAVAVAILVDDGKLSFDDSLEEYLPEYEALDVRTGQQGVGTAAVTRPITIRDVLTHTSGLGEVSAREPHWTLEETARQVANNPLLFQPGSQWRYSTAGLDVLGRVVEVVSGQSFDRFLDERVFEPLGMSDTSFWLSPEERLRFVTNYRRSGDAGPLAVAQIAYFYKTDPTDRRRPPLGGAGLFSTAEDVGRFYQMILGGGAYQGTRILKQGTVAEMIRKHTGVLEARPGMPWGLGFCVVEDPGAMEANHMLTPGSYGHGGAHGTSSWVDPTKGAIYVIMLQRAGLRNPDNSDMHRVFQEIASSAFVD